MFCFSCGQDLPDTARFCSNCGTNLRGVTVRPTTEIETEIETEESPEIENEVIICFKSLPFESIIIEKFNDELPYLYKSHVQERLREALEDAKNNGSLNQHNYSALNKIVWGEAYIRTFGDLAFLFKRLHEHWPLMRPTVHMLIELLFCVYLKK